jgi:hypothetical protein
VSHPTNFGGRCSVLTDGPRAASKIKHRRDSSHPSVVPGRFPFSSSEYRLLFHIDSGCLSWFPHAVLHIENGGAFIVVDIADGTDLRCPPVMEFIGLFLPAPAGETVVVQTGIGHGENVVVRVDQRQAGELGATLGTVVPVRRWMDVEPEAAAAVFGGVNSVLEVKRDLRLSVGHPSPFASRLQKESGRARLARNRTARRPLVIVGHCPPITVLCP